MKVSELFEARQDDWTGYVRPSDLEWERRMRGAQKEREAFIRYGKLEQGEANGKPFNLVATIEGPSDHRLQNQVNKFLDHERNIYHDFVDIKTTTIGEGRAKADIYINAKPQSLLLRAVEGGYYADMSKLAKQQQA